MQVFDASTLLSNYKLRATRPRLSVANLLFKDGIDKHVTAESVANELSESGEDVALATVYNTLHNFVNVGLLREVHGAERGLIIFDTNTSPHHHFYHEITRQLRDIPADAIELTSLPTPPEGTQTIGWEVIVRVR